MTRLDEVHPGDFGEILHEVIPVLPERAKWKTERRSRLLLDIVEAAARNIYHKSPMYERPILAQVLMAGRNFIEYNQHRRPAERIREFNPLQPVDTVRNGHRQAAIA